MQYTKLLILQLSVVFYIFVSNADFSSPVEPPCSGPALSEGRHQTILRGSCFLLMTQGTGEGGWTTSCGHPASTKNAKPCKGQIKQMDWTQFRKMNFRCNWSSSAVLLSLHHFCSARYACFTRFISASLVSSFLLSFPSRPLQLYFSLKLTPHFLWTHSTFISCVCSHCWHTAFPHSADTM